ncbi:MAG TPA: LuxR C-terminal-related transcriptional regulator [Chloroflexota bacterium]|jgi:DNA-binding CsgD family transcriptional regulator
MQPSVDGVRGNSERLLSTLVRLLAIRSPELRPALDEAAMPLLEAVDAEKIDVFLYQDASATLVAMGTSDTPVARRQKQLGLDRQAIANGGRVVDVFQTGVPVLEGHVDQDRGELPGVREALAARSIINVAVEVDGDRRGVLSAISTQPEKFTEQDLEFMQAVAGWVGMIAERAQLSEAMAEQAYMRGQRNAAAEVARLTPRQREVAACIAEGLTNEEVAERLVLVNGTVANHVQAILTRLGLRNRTQIAAWAVERGLYQTAMDVGPPPEVNELAAHGRMTSNVKG